MKLFLLVNNLVIFNQFFSRIPRWISSGIVRDYSLLVNDRQKELAEAVESKYKVIL